MNFVIGVIGANLTLGVISGITGTANSIYTLSSTILQTTANGANEIKQIIRETDLEIKIKTTQLLLCELKINENSPNTVIYCIQAIKDAIREIADELDKIYYRMQYNNSLLFGATIRAYKFHNCKSRLHAKLKNLESRNQSLISIMTIQNLMYKNDLFTEQDKINNTMLQLEHIDPKNNEID